ncbi:MAG: gliding motility-associated ABC transporter substrate-binding protein GldG [Paludibacteraceae bacterium]|nr:gliding motility-associated ABC transporter substrate-binding protein GldG [Paludibacteraceae bacterium]MBO7724462.1 gliding motility-associated ABC transporter substrate-binding protein GldG [Paludibacteraceae bacterium]
MKNKYIFALSAIALIVVLNLCLQRSFFRVDLTSEKRFSISDNTKDLMKNLQSPILVKVYLDGDLNSGFLRLKNSLRELLDEFSVYAKNDIEYTFINPSQADSEEERMKNYERLEQRGLTHTTIYERDNEGKMIQKMVFPWAEIVTEKDTFPVNLLKNIAGNSGAENLNISIENLEFELTDAIRILNSKQVQKIAFLEGHGELTEEFVYDISSAFSRYFQVDRGVIGTDASVLNDYKAIVVAKPDSSFNETEKYIIDQYIMNGGRVLWLLDGVQMSMQQLVEQGTSPAISLDVNLSDLLFRYGVRINNALVQDVQCVQMPLNVSASSAPQYEAVPWIFSPILLTSPQHPITRNLSQVKADFCSYVDFTGENLSQKASILLATSSASHIVQVPAMIDLNEIVSGFDDHYFNTSFVPVAVALEGVFSSGFQNRMLPKGIENAKPQKGQSVETRMVVIADGDIIKNEIVPTANGYQVLPVGYDRYSGMQFGNRDFILNALLYLTDDEGWINLRNRTFKLRMLNKKTTLEQKTLIKWTNLLLPIFLLLVFGSVYLSVRYFYYRKK